MKILYTLALIATLSLALGAGAQPQDKSEAPATPVFLAGVDSGGAGAGMELPDGLYLADFSGRCARITGLCVCIVSGPGHCDGELCQLMGANGCILQ